jgi:hypothetical protein
MENFTPPKAGHGVETGKTFTWRVECVNTLAKGEQAGMFGMENS